MSLAYPAFDVLVAAVVLVLGAQVPLAARGPYVLQASGMTLFAVTDSIYVLL